MESTNTNRKEANMIQLPDRTDRYVAIQKMGQKIHLALPDNLTAICDDRVLGEVVTGTRDESAVCRHCRTKSEGMDLFTEVVA